MGLRRTGISATQQMIHNTAERASKGSRDAIERGAHKIKDRSVAYSPVIDGDHGLEEAHSVGSDQKNSFSRKTFTVFVDKDYEGKESGVKVGDYLDFIHEDTTYEIGEDSKKKKRRTGYVGPKFMELAFLELEDEIMADVKREAHKGVGH